MAIIYKPQSIKIKLRNLKNKKNLIYLHHKYFIYLTSYMKTFFKALWKFLLIFIILLFCNILGYLFWFVKYRDMIPDITVWLILFIIIYSLIFLIYNAIKKKKWNSTKGKINKTKKNLYRKYILWTIIVLIESWFAYISSYIILFSISLMIYWRW